MNGVSIECQAQAYGAKSKGFTITLNPISFFEEIKPKNCKVQNLVVTSRHKEIIDTSDIQVYCNKVLIKDSSTMQKGENLLHRRDMFYISPKHFLYKEFEWTLIQFHTDSALLKGTYTFYVSGITSLNNTFSDSTTITFN